MNKQSPVLFGRWHVKVKMVDCERLCGSHVSEESMVLKVLERLRFIKGPLLVECGRSFSAQQEIAKLRHRPDVDTHRFPSSHRRGNANFFLTCGPCRFARCSVLLQFQQSEMSRQTFCSTLHSNSPLVGTRFGGTFTTRKDGGTYAWDVACVCQHFW